MAVSGTQQFFSGSDRGEGSGVTEATASDYRRLRQMSLLVNKSGLKQLKLLITELTINLAYI